DVIVGEGSLMVCVRELRRKLGDDAKIPRFIETAPRRGYRFVGPISVVPSRADRRSAEANPPRRGAPGFQAFGRRPGLECLHGWLGRALTGRRQVAFVTGETGGGKTTLIEAFILENKRHDGLMIARGQCAEHYGAAEPYLPFLDALAGLCRGPAGGDVV